MNAALVWSQILPYAPFVVGVGCAVVSGYLYFRYSRFLSQAERVDATVVHVLQEESSEGTTLYRAVVRYSASGQTYEHVSHAAFPCNWVVAQKVQVRCRPDDPKQVMLPGIYSPLWEVGFFAFMAAGFLVSGTVLLCMFGKYL